VSVLVRNHEVTLAQDLDWWARIVYPIALIVVLLVSLVIWHSCEWGGDRRRRQGLASRLRPWARSAR
jgi:hypothetical protein